jgi:hypothetical protein
MVSLDHSQQADLWRKTNQDASWHTLPHDLFHVAMASVVELAIPANSWLGDLPVDWSWRMRIVTFAGESKRHARLSFLPGPMIFSRNGVVYTRLLPPPCCVTAERSDLSFIGTMYETKRLEVNRRGYHQGLRLIPASHDVRHGNEVGGGVGRM